MDGCFELGKIKISVLGVLGGGCIEKLAFADVTDFADLL